MSQKGNFSSSNLNMSHKFFFPRDVTDEKGQQGNKEKLVAMRAEYEKYKELWGLNLYYSHSAGAARNYSKLQMFNFSL